MLAMGKLLRLCDDDNLRLLCSPPASRVWAVESSSHTHTTQTQTHNAPMKTTNEQTESEKQARAQLQSIRELVGNLRRAEAANDDRAADDARQAIQEDALSVEVREGWHGIGEKAEIEEANCTGGPAVRIIAKLDQYQQAESVRIEHRDWGTPWTAIPWLDADEAEDVLIYCNCFYFGN